MQEVNERLLLAGLRQQELAEAAERERREKVALLESTAEGICGVDVEGRCTFVNRSAAQMLGYTREELLGRDVHALIHQHPEGAPGPAIACPMADALLGGPSVRMADVEVLLRRNGTTFPVTYSAFPIVEGAERRGTVLTFADITDRKLAEEALEHQAFHDPLTGLPNRSLFQDRLQQAIIASRRDHDSLALLLMDLDRFKLVNDTLGHHAGDQLLQQVGRRLQGAIRASDTVARLGGDEFALVLPRSEGVGAVVAAQKLLQALEPPFLLEDQSLVVEASVGIALHPDHGADAETLLRRADMAMYEAKRSGNGYALYTSEQDRHSVARLALLGELRVALDGDELRLHYQPIVRCSTGEVVGAEALVYWQHPERGLLPPEQFVPLAEQTGLIRPLSRWVLDAALRQLQAWQQAGLELVVAVNLSARDLQDPELPETIADLLRQRSVPAGRLKVEVTESGAMADPDASVAVLTRVRALGVGIAIDNFGTGYSSLGYLKRLPTDELKIDRSFVRDMVTSESDAAIVRAATTLAHQLGLGTVAEGVEDEATWALLVSVGCDGAQGHYISRPRPAGRFVRWLNDWRARQPDLLPDAAEQANLSVLSRVELLRRIPPDGLVRLARLGRRRLCGAGSPLLRRGDVGDSVHVIVKGRVRVERPLADPGEPVTLAELGPGEIVGELGALDGEPRSATVTALEETETFELSATALAMTAMQYPQVTTALLQVLSRRLRSTDDLVEALVRRAEEPSAD